MTVPVPSTAPSRRPGTEVDVPERWVPSWGVAYGGFVASLLAGAVERARPPGQVPLQLHVSFLRPVRAGGAEVTVAPVSAGRRATRLRAHLDQGGRRVAEATAWCAASRAGPGREPPPPTAPPPEDCPPAVVVGQPTVPTFMGTDIDLRTIAPGHEWVSAGREVDLEVLALVADLGGAGAFALAGGAPTTLASLDLTLHVLRPARGRWLQCRSEVTAVDGRSSARATYWDGEGVVATMSQVALVALAAEEPTPAPEPVTIDRPTGRSGTI